MTTGFYTKLISELPGIENFKIGKINHDISEYYALFVDDPNYLTVSLIQNPFHQITDLTKIKNTFNEKIVNGIILLNRLHEMDQEIMDKSDIYKKIIILFLINYKFLLSHQEFQANLSKNKLEYAMNLLEKIEISEIRDELEDKLFAKINPKHYYDYLKNLKSSKRAYLHVEKKFKNELYYLLKSQSIYANVQSRFKSIYSVHKKIIKKNIILSQVLDVIGIRVITDNVKECYQAMEVIINHWPVMNDRIKDFIAVPKDNGYQCIHLTILVDNNPVEIQIRSKEMHYHAQYGKFAHHLYKNLED